MRLEKPIACTCRWWGSRIAAGLAAALAGGCAMADSTIVDGLHGRCKSHLGSYHLSRSVVDITVKEVKTTLLDDKDLIEESVQHEVAISEPLRTADPSFTYCLDYLASPTAADVVDVTFTSDNTLQKITSDADDKTVAIVKALIKTLFTVFSGPTPRAATGSQRIEVETREVFKARFDPLNAEEANNLNIRMAKFDFCLITDERPGYEILEADYKRYCAKPEAYSEVSRAAVRDLGGLAPAQYGVDYGEGIFYRPRLPYNFYLFERKNRKLAQSWELRRRSRVMLENASPIMRVGIDRTIFTNRQTVLTFDQGVLQNVGIAKGSEVAAFVQIPLFVVQSVIALPASIIKFKIDNTANQKVLVQAEQNLMQAMLNRLQCRNAYQQAVQGDLAATCTPKASLDSKVVDNQFLSNELKPKKQ